MKAIRIASFIIAFIALCYYGYQLLGNPNGKKYTFSDKHHVFYKGDGVGEDDAKKAANYFSEIGLFTAESEMDVQLSAEKKSDDLKVRFVVNKDKFSPEVETGFMNIGNDMATKVFPDKVLHIIVTDVHFEDIKEIGIARATQPSIQNNTDIKQTDDEK